MGDREELIDDINNSISRAKGAYSSFMGDRGFYDGNLTEVHEICLTLMGVCMELTNQRKNDFNNKLSKESENGFPTTLMVYHSYTESDTKIDIETDESEELQRLARDWGNLADNTWDTMKHGGDIFIMECAEQISLFCMHWASKMEGMEFDVHAVLEIHGKVSVPEIWQINKPLTLGHVFDVIYWAVYKTLQKM